MSVTSDTEFRVVNLSARKWVTYNQESAIRFKQNVTNE